MKVVVIGDIHGRRSWKFIVKRNVGAHFIFLGDYTDPYKVENISEEQCIENLEEILDFKLANKDKVTLLIGNHDAQYFYPNLFATTAMSKDYVMELMDLYYYNKNLFQFAYQKGNYLFTHAGVSNQWFNRYIGILNGFGLKDDLSNIGKVLNSIGDSKYLKIFSDVSKIRNGQEENGSPLWADISEVEFDSLDGIHQVVGHSKVYDIGTSYGNDDKTSITFCDCLWRYIKALTINI